MPRKAQQIMQVLNLLETLNDREKEIYDLLCDNLSNEEIAEKILISANGVKFHLKAIYRKLGITGNCKFFRQQAILYGGTKITQVYQEVKEIYQAKIESYQDKNLYTKEEIFSAIETITWFDKERMSDILDDIFKVLESRKRKDSFSAMHRLPERIKTK